MIRGRPAGRNHKQEQVWSKNEEKIVYTLMDKFSFPARIKNLEEKIGLSRRTLYKHIRALENKGIIEENNGNFLLKPDYYFKNEDVKLQRPYEHPIQKDKGILVVRIVTDNHPITCKINAGSISQQYTGTEIASTIPFTAQPTIQLIPTQNKPINYQIMAFKPNLKQLKVQTKLR